MENPGRLVGASKTLQTTGKVAGPIQAYGRGAQVIGGAIRGGIVGSSYSFPEAHTTREPLQSN